MAGVLTKTGGVFSSFDASDLASKFGIFTSKIAASKTPTEIFDTEKVISSGLGRFADAIIGFLYKLIYFICKFALSLVDFFEAIVRKLSGISAVGKSYSLNDDLNGNPIFRFLLNDTVLTVFLSLVGFAILMLIIFVIIGIVRTEFDAATDDKANSKGPIFRRAFKSLFLFVAIPIFLFIFIFGTNAVLNSANAAFKKGTGESATLGGTIFVASTYEANKYRNYADLGTRTPITYDFEDPAETNYLQVMTPEQIRDTYASWTDAKKFYSAFANGKHDKFTETVVYRNGKVYNSSSYSQFEDFVTTPEEYYVLADFLDYSVTNALEYYIKPLDDGDINWDAVKYQIGAAMYYSILEDMRFNIAYKNTSGINGNEKNYIREYVNSYGSASTPMAEALRSAQMILGIGDYSENTFKILERVDGYVNYVRWASEMAFDSATGETMRVYKITKYTYNTLIDEIQEREPQLVVQYNGQYFAVKKLEHEGNSNGIKYWYECDTNNAGTKIDRVSIDYKLINQAGEDYLDPNGEIIMMPKDKLEVFYKKVSWPEKLYNDLLVVYGNIFKDALVNGNGDWMTIETTPGGGASSSGSINIPTAFISPAGLIMSELFLGTRLDTEEGISVNSSTYGSVYSDKTLSAVLRTISGEDNYVNLKGQIDAFEAIFDNMMAGILDDVATQEGVSNVDDSVSMNTYKQYLATIMMTDEFSSYFGDLAKCIVLFNQILVQFNENNEIPAYETLVDTYKSVITNEVLNVLDHDTLAWQIVNNYATAYNGYYDDDNNYDDGYSGYNGWSYDFYAVRNAADVTLAGVDLEEYLADLYSKRNSAYVKYRTITTQPNLNALKNLDEQIYSTYKYILKTAFRDAVTAKTTQNINITINGNTYNVLLTLSTTQIAELAFGNQLKIIAPEFYDSDSKFMFVEPTYSGIMTALDVNGNPAQSLSEINHFSAPFELLSFFARKFGDISFALNNSNFVDIAYGASDDLVAEDFYQAFALYIKNYLFAQLPDVARMAGIVSLNDKDVISWEITAFDVESNKFTIKGQKGVSTKNESGETTIDKINFDTTVNMPTISNAELVRRMVEYWGFEFENSQYGFSYSVTRDENGVYAVIDGVTYYVEETHYASRNDDNSVVISENAAENIIAGNVITFVNGKQYLVVGDSVTIGSEVVGKTLLDYRRDAMNKIAYLESRSGETDVELQDRFLSMFYLMSAEVVDNTIKTDVYSKRVIKLLAGEENRPDENLVNKEYSTDFSSILKDESRGTVFIICTYDADTEMFVPFLVSNMKNTADTFVSKYVTSVDGDNSLVFYPIVARGIIDSNGNPTAIRMNENGDIEFYRDDMYIVNASNIGISMYYQSVEDIRVKKSIVSTVVNGVTKLFTGKTLTQMIVEKIPRLTADSTLNFAYGSREEVVAVAEQGKFQMSYNFKTLGIDYFYSVRDLNIVVLLFGTVMIFSALLVAVWGLIQRIWDITVLFLIAPPIIATLPLAANDQTDEKGAVRYMNWRDKMVSSVLSVFGIVVGLNVFFLFVPIISDIVIFKESNAIIEKFGGVDFVNYVFRVLFLFAAIGLIRRAPKLLQPLVSGGNDQDIFSKGEATKSNVRASIETVKDHVSGQYAYDKARQVAGMVKNSIPGMPLMETAIEKGKEAKDKATAKTAEIIARANGVPKDVAKQASHALAEQMAAQRQLKKNEKLYVKRNIEQREVARESMTDDLMDDKAKKDFLDSENKRIQGLSSVTDKASKSDAGVIKKLRGRH